MKRKEGQENSNRKKRVRWEKCEERAGNRREKNEWEMRRKEERVEQGGRERREGSEREEGKETKGEGDDRRQKRKERVHLVGRKAAKKRDFDGILNFGGSCTHLAPSPISAEFGAQDYTGSNLYSFPQISP